MLVGQGKRQYEVVENWPKVPEGTDWNQVVEIVVDSQDRVFIFHRGTPSPMIFSTDGEYQGGWPKDNPWPDIHGVTLGSDGDGEYLIIVDRNSHQAGRSTMDGEIVWKVGTQDTPGPDNTPFNLPTDSAIAPNGDIYISDGYGNNAVHQYSSTGEHIRSWGSHGVGPGQFDLPHGVRVIDRQGEPTVYVCDRENHRMQLFTLEGGYISEFNGLRQPTDLVVDDDGVRYVSELLHRLTILNEDDSVLAHIGGESASAEPGSFLRPHTIAFDSARSMWVGEVNTRGQVGRVSKYRRL